MINSNLELNSRVSVEKILTETWESPMIMRNAIFKGFKNGSAHIIEDDKTTSETYYCGWSGFYNPDTYNIKNEE